jgi:hypothetical protein
MFYVNNKEKKISRGYTTLHYQFTNRHYIKITNKITIYYITKINIHVLNL